MRVRAANLRLVPRRVRPGAARGFVRLLAVALLMLFILLGAVAYVQFGMSPRRNLRPSILLVVLDTLRADRLDGGRGVMPFLDGFAAKGMRFRAARANANWTLPSHASIFTGRMPSEHGCTFEHRYLHDSAVTLAETLQKLGYATGGFSSNVNVGRLYHLDQGFDTFVESWRDDEVRAGAPASDVMMRRLLQFLDDSKARPRFAFLNLMDAHLPYDAAPGFETAFGAEGARLDRALLAAPDFLDRVLTGELKLDAAFVAALAQRYDSAVRGLDARLEELVKQLELRRFFDDGILIVTSDHGENLGEHGRVDHQGSLAETVLRVPLVIVGAGIPPGTVVDEPFTLMRIPPWIQDFMNGSPPVPRGNPPPALSERMPPIEVLDRLRARAPGFDPGPLARVARALVVPGVRAKLLAFDDEPGQLVTLEPAAGASDAPLVDPPLLERMRATYADVLRRRRPSKENAVPEAPDVEEAAAAYAELARIGYVGASGTAAPKVSIHAEEHLRRGNRAYAAQDFAAARREFQDATRIQPDFADAWFNLALAVERTAPEQALATWERYVDVAGRSGDQDADSIRKAARRIDELKKDS